MAFEKKKACPPFEIRLMTDEDVEQVLDIWKEIGLYEGMFVFSLSSGQCLYDDQ